MCQLMNQFKKDDDNNIPRNETELSDEQLNQYEILEKEARQANKTSMATAYVSIFRDRKLIICSEFRTNIVRTFFKTQNFPKQS